MLSRRRCSRRECGSCRSPANPGSAELDEGRAAGPGLLRDAGGGCVCFTGGVGEAGNPHSKIPVHLEPVRLCLSFPPAPEHPRCLMSTREAPGIPLFSFPPHYGSGDIVLLSQPLPSHHSPPKGRFHRGTGALAAGAMPPRHGGHRDGPVPPGQGL